MSNNSFKNRVIKKLERQGYRVHPIWNDNNRCPFDLISFNPNGKGAGVKLKAHGHISKEEREELMWYDMPIYIGREGYSLGKEHKIKIEELK